MNKMIQKITQNNWNFRTVNLIMRAKKIVNQSSDFRVRRTGSYRHKKALLTHILTFPVLPFVGHVSLQKKDKSIQMPFVAQTRVG